LVVALAVAIPLGIRNGNFRSFTEGIPLFLGFTSFVTVGLLVLSRHPRQPIGWIFAGIGLLATVGVAAQEYAHYTVITRPGALPGAAWAAWLAAWWWYPMLGGVLVLTPLLFPTGRPPTPRWRWALRLALATGVAITVLAMLNPRFELQDARGVAVRNPIGIEAVGNVEESTAGGVLFLMLVIALIGAVASVIVRYRRSRGEERQQLKWFVYGAALLPTIPLSDLLPSSPVIDQVQGVGFGLVVSFLPISAGIAILKYRLYDIDLVVNKTLVYGSLAGFITAVYVGMVVGIGNAIGTRGEPNLGLQIGGTAVIAVAFQPVRARVQRLANRLVYGERASPYEVLSGFSHRLGSSYAIDDVLPRLAQVVAEGTRAASASVWIRVGDALRAAARWPAGDGGVPMPVPTDEGIVIPGAERSLPVRHRGELLGALAVEKSAGDRIRPEEDRLLGDLAAQAGLVLRNVRLTEELQFRLQDITRLAGELGESRRRIVTVGDAERRRLERNIHDGAQQHLVALAVQLKLARSVSAKDPEKARSHLEDLVRSTEEALRVLRNLVRGIYPPLLEADGLAAALEAEARRATPPAMVMTEQFPRFPSEIEAAAYFAVLEALQNATKYADASRIEVHLSREEGTLIFMVADDGKGFDPSVTPSGSGLQNMEDRLATVGGTLHVESTPGRGTTVRGAIQIQEEK
jgi:signal transduction histidine kinase